MAKGFDIGREKEKALRQRRARRVAAMRRRKASAGGVFDFAGGKPWKG
jgi:hypothetical protein